MKINELHLHTTQMGHTNIILSRQKNPYIKKHILDDDTTDQNRRLEVRIMANWVGSGEHAWKGTGRISRGL